MKLVAATLFAGLVSFATSARADESTVRTLPMVTIYGRARQAERRRRDHASSTGPRGRARRTSIFGVTLVEASQPAPLR
jgi:hypothetical protein